MNNEYPATCNEPLLVLRPKWMSFVERMIGVLRWLGPEPDDATVEDVVEHVVLSMCRRLKHGDVYNAQLDPRRRCELRSDIALCNRVGGVEGLLELWREGKRSRKHVRALDRYLKQPKTVPGERAASTARSGQLPPPALVAPVVPVETAPGQLDRIEGVVCANAVRLERLEAMVRQLLGERSGEQIKLGGVA